MRRFWIGVAWLLAFAFLCEGAIAAESVTVVSGPNAPEVEKFAASELCGYLDTLFGVRAKSGSSNPTDATSIFLVGSPTTNSLIAGDQFGKRSDQGIVLKSVHVDSKPTMIVGGGSPRATLWAVYELAEQWGVRFLLHGDVLPARRPFEMPAIDVARE